MLVLISSILFVALIMQDIINVERLINGHYQYVLKCVSVCYPSSRSLPYRLRKTCYLNQRYLHNLHVRVHVCLISVNKLAPIPILDQKDFNILLAPGQVTKIIIFIIFLDKKG